MKIAVLGTGKMGAAMAKGLTRDGGRIWDIVLTNTTGRLPESLSGLELPCTNSNREAVIGADVVILAVLPQQYPDVLAEIRDAAEPGACLISIAPGYTLEKLNALTNGRFQIVRAMPNTPALIGEGMIALCRGEGVSDDTFELAGRVLSGLGRVETVKESQLNAVIGVSGSAPAYVYMFVDALADAGVLGGLHRDQAVRMAAQMLYGSAALLCETGKSPAELREMVCSPAGTTIEAVASLEESGFRGAVIKAAGKAMEKAKKMG